MFTSPCKLVARTPSSRFAPRFRLRLMTRTVTRLAAAAAGTAKTAQTATTRARHTCTRLARLGQMKRITTTTQNSHSTKSGWGSAGVASRRSQAAVAQARAGRETDRAFTRRAVAPDASPAGGEPPGRDPSQRRVRALASGAARSQGAWSAARDGTQAVHTAAGPGGCDEQDRSRLTDDAHQGSAHGAGLQRTSRGHSRTDHRRRRDRGREPRLRSPRTSRRGPLLGSTAFYFHGGRAVSVVQFSYRRLNVSANLS